MPPADWDVFCRVVDNHGDVGVCWRLAADLAAHGCSVRLWIDDPSALAWMAPAGAAGVSVHAWPGDDADTPPAGVVVEAFGCDLPHSVVARMAARARPPVWIDLEYLSAEAYVDRSHGLASPQGNGLVKWFFYPGVTPRTGGLIRETDLMSRRSRLDAAAWLAGQRIVPLPGERVVSLFCYEQPALPALFDALDDRPTLLLTTPGHAARQTADILGAWAAEGVAQRGLRLLPPTLLGRSARPGGVRAVALPALTQRDYDHLLWSCDLNFVRGEDSFVRAQWAGAPFVWQAYPQADGAHHAKVRAFLDRHLADTPGSLRSGIERLWHAWNGQVDAAAGGASRLVLPDLAVWHHATTAWRTRLLDRPSLTLQLLDFARRKG